MLMMAVLSFACGYCISVGMKQILPFPETISNTGTVPPASCVFSLLLSISAMFGVVFMYFRHGHLELIFDENDGKSHTVNDISFFIGVLSCFGILIVACFQVTKVWIPHMAGAALGFISGCVYCWLQSYLSYVVAGTMGRKIVLRIVLAASGSLGLLLYFVFAKLAGVDDPKKDLLHWLPSVPGYVWRVISCFFEWICALSVLGYFLTFYKEFLEVDFKVHVGHKQDDTADNNGDVKKRYNTSQL